MLEVRNLTKTFKKKTALNDISITLDEGIYGLLGANGAGKTTLLRCLTLLYPEGRSTIFWDAEPVSKNKDYLDKIGYLPQQFGLFKELTILEAMRLMSNFKGVTKENACHMIEECLELVNLSNEKNKKVSSLSGGMIRRLGIAQALINYPNLLLFDEPTAGLDPMERLRFKTILSKIDKHKTIIISTHIVEDIEAVCQKVIIMDCGEIKACLTCSELRALAAEKVYEILETDVKKLPGKIYVEKIFERNGHKFARVLASEKQNFDTCTPNIEDGYLCVINGI